MSGFDYKTNFASVMQALKDYNTTTASPNLSLSLTTAVVNDNIIGMFPKIEQVRADKMPTIFVSVNTKEEEYAGIGATGASGAKKFATVSYDIYAFVGKQAGGWDNHSSTVADIHNLARNMEAVFQAEYKLSNTAMWCNPIRTEFSNPLNINQNQTMVFYMQLQAKYLFR